MSSGGKPALTSTGPLLEMQMPKARTFFIPGFVLAVAGLLFASEAAAWALVVAGAGLMAAGTLGGPTGGNARRKNAYAGVARAPSNEQRAERAAVVSQRGSSRVAARLAGAGTAVASAVAVAGLAGDSILGPACADDNEYDHFSAGPTVNVDGTPMIEGTMLDVTGKVFGDSGDMFSSDDMAGGFGNSGFGMGTFGSDDSFSSGGFND